jgi:murein L,D-transpeptidase YafK
MTKSITSRRRMKNLLFICLAGLSLIFSQISEAGLPKADKVIVIKSKRIMLLLSDGEILRTYRVALGKNPEGRKIMAGDKKTPEGRYTLSKNSNSRFHLSLRISYPNEADIERASRLGVLPGGDIMIHGLPEGLAEFGKFHRYYDWTDGCIAVTNSEIEEIYQMVDDGTPIEIMP